MSQSQKTAVEHPHALLRHLATDPHASHPIPKAEAPQEIRSQEEPLSSDIRAFCSLIARILMRCLKERNPRVMELLSLSAKAEEAEIGETHDAA